MICHRGIVTTYHWDEDANKWPAKGEECSTCKRRQDELIHKGEMMKKEEVPYGNQYRWKDADYARSDCTCTTCKNTILWKKENELNEDETKPNHPSIAARVEWDKEGKTYMMINGKKVGPDVALNAEAKSIKRWIEGAWNDLKRIIQTELRKVG